MNTVIYLLKFALFCIAGGVIFVIGYFVYYWRKDVREANELRFDVMYCNIKRLLDYYPVNKSSQLKLMSHFKDLRACKFKNVEKVQVLWTKFVLKYKEVGREHLKEADEFSIQDGDLDERSMKRFE